MRASNNDIYQRLDRIEDLLSSRLDKLDGKVDAVKARMDRLEGGIDMFRWLGPTGVAALIFGIAKSMGLL